VKALLYGVTPEFDGADLPEDTPAFVRALRTTPMDLRELDAPTLPADDWVVLKTRMCGICGSDAKQVFMDGEPDNAMTALISFPQVLGHELVADVVEAGPTASVVVGQRVVMNPWLSCGPRGIDPPCEACAAGSLNLCHHFSDGHLAPGIHSGNSSDATGGFGELVPAHDSMCIPVPDDVPDEVAVLADPTSVSFHAILRHPPPEGGHVLVYGAGALGTTTTAIVRALYPSVTVGVVAKFPKQAELARHYGATVFAPEPEQLIADVAEWCGATVRTPFLGLKWLHPGGVDVVYDTVASPETLEVGVRVAKARGVISISGVSTPARFEWTPWYFKELTLAGSNAFGIEDFEGTRKHAMAHYFDLVRSGRLDVSPMLTHTFRLDEWREAFGTLADQGASGAVKVAFDLR